MTLRKLFAATASLLAIAGATYLFRPELERALPNAAPFMETISGAVARLRSITQASASAPSERYRTTPVKRGNIRQTVTATGTLNAVVTVEVGTQLSGQLAKVLADFNDEVKKGQPLAELDRRSFEAKLAEARAATATARSLVAVQESRIERARIDIRDAKTRTAVLEARIESAKARLDAAEKALKRVTALNTRGVSSSTQLDQAESDRDAAAANLREAEALAAAHVHTIAAAEVELKRAEAELASAHAGVPQKQAAERLAEIDLERTIIRAPIDGVVVGRSFSEGQTVAASLEAPTLFMIAGDLEQMDIHARVDESDIGKIKVGQKATFTVDAHPGRPFEAEVSAVRKAPTQQQQPGSLLRRIPQSSSNVVTYTVVLRTGNSAGLLLPGMTAVVRIVVDEAQDVLMVPMAAIRFTPQVKDDVLPAEQPLPDRHELVWIWNKEAQKLRPQTVRIGSVDGIHAAVLSTPAAGALKVGDAVVTAEEVDAPRKRTFGMNLGF